MQLPYASRPYPLRVGTGDTLANPRFNRTPLGEATPIYPTIGQPPRYTAREQWQKGEQLFKQAQQEHCEEVRRHCQQLLARKTISQQQQQSIKYLFRLQMQGNETVTELIAEANLRQLCHIVAILAE